MKEPGTTRYAAEDKESLRIIDEMIELHKAAKLELGPKKSKTKAWAVWLLLGTSLTLTKDAVSDVSSGHETSLWNNLRYATEVLDLIAYLNRKSTPRKAAVEWFDGDMKKAPRVKQNPWKGKQQREFDQEQVDATAYRNDVGEKYSWIYSPDMNQLLSGKTMHPSYSSVRFSFFYSQKAGSLDPYEISRGSMDDSTARYLMMQYLEIAVLGFFNSMLVLKYPTDAYARLEGLYTEISSLRRIALGLEDD